MKPKLLFPILIFIIVVLNIWSSPPGDCPNCWKQLAKKLTGKALPVSVEGTIVKMDLSVVQGALKQSGLEEKVTLELKLKDQTIAVFASTSHHSLSAKLTLPNAKSTRAFTKSGKHSGTLVLKTQPTKSWPKLKSK